MISLRVAVACFLATFSLVLAIPLLEESAAVAGVDGVSNALREGREGVDSLLCALLPAPAEGPPLPPPCPCPWGTPPAPAAAAAPAVGKGAVAVAVEGDGTGTGAGEAACDAEPPPVSCMLKTTEPRRYDR
jgi:hypothetical protein